MKKTKHFSWPIFSTAIKFSFFLFCAVMVNLSSLSNADANTGTLTWTANTEPDLAGYEIFFGDQPGVYNHPSSPISVGTVTSYNFPEGMLIPGITYYFALKAKDTAGNRSGLSAEVSGTILNDTTPPTISIDQPDKNAEVSGIVTISAIAFDDSGIESVQFFVNDSPIGEELTSSPFTTTWDTTSLLPNSYSLKAIARDAFGNEATSEPITVFVTQPPVDNSFPTVSITNPTSGSELSGVIKITATASDNLGVKGVRFFVDDTQVGGEDTSAPYETSWDTTSLPVGSSHQLKAVATDAAGNETTSDIVTVKVGEAPTGPLEISDLFVASGRSYQIIQNGLADQAQPYIDRKNWTFSNVPSSLVGATYIQTANRDKNLKNTVFLSFTISQPATIYVAHDVRITKKPAWLNSFTKTGMVLKIEGNLMDLYSKPFPAGTVQLGGNAGKDTSMYSVLVASSSTNNGSGGSDTTPPTVTLTSPTSASEVSGIVPITATALDNIAVEAVRFYVNDIQVGVEDTTAPYETSWNTTSLPVGSSHQLKAVATDTAGNETISDIVTVKVGEAPTGPLEISDLFVASGRPYKIIQHGLANQAQPYIDRKNWTFSNVPSSLKDATYIRTANRDKNLKNTVFLSFTISQPATIYVAHDVRITKKPSWINSFTKTGMVLKIKGNVMDLYSKPFPAGTVQLGGNAGKDTSMYSVIIVSP